MSRELRFSEWSDTRQKKEIRKRKSECDPQKKIKKTMKSVGIIISLGKAIGTNSYQSPFCRGRGLTLSGDGAHVI